MLNKNRSINYFIATKPVCHNSEKGILWPIEKEWESTFKKWCAFGGVSAIPTEINHDIEITAYTKNDAKTYSSPKKVFSLNDSCTDEAVLYCAIVGCTYAGNQIDYLIYLNTSSIQKKTTILLGLYEDLTPDIIALQENLGMHALGLILGRDKTELFQFTIKSALSLKICPVAEPNLSIIAPQSTLPSTYSTPFRFLSSDYFKEMRKSLSEIGATDFLAIYTHGDGFDLNFGSQYGCTIAKSIEQGHHSQNPPSCISRNKCYRVDLSPAEFFNSEKFIDIGKMHVHGGFLGSCSAFLFKDGLSDGSRGYFWELLQYFFGILTPWDHCFLSLEMVVRVAELAYSGFSLGEIKNILSNSPIGGHYGLRLVVLGDPDMRITMPEIELQNLLRNKPFRRTTVSKNEIEMSANFESMTGISLLNQIDVDAFVETNLIRLPDFWVNEMRSLGWMSASCYSCGCAVAKNGRFITAFPSNLIRLLQICPLCGETADIDESLNFHVSLYETTIKVSGLETLPKNSFRVFTITRSNFRGSKSATEWRDGEISAPLKSLCVGSGIFAISVLIISNNRYSVKTVYTRN